MISFFWLLTFLVVSKHNYLIYKANKNKSCKFKLLKHKFKKNLKIVKCSRNFEFEKQTDQNFITQNLHHGKEYCIS